MNDTSLRVALDTLERALEQLRTIKFMDERIPVDVATAAMNAHMDVAFAAGMLGGALKAQLKRESV